MPGALPPDTGALVLPPGNANNHGIATLQQIGDWAQQAGFKGKDLQIAIAVSCAEDTTHKISARGGPNSDGSYDHGLWQINDSNLSSVGFSADQLESSGLINAQAAHKVWKSQGWHAWSTYNSGAYLAYMGRAKGVAKNASSDSSFNGAMGGIPDALASPFDALASAVADIAKIFAFLFSKQFLYIMAGGIVVLIGFILVVKQTSAGRAAIQQAGTVAKGVAFE